MLEHKFCRSCGHIQISKIVEDELIKKSGILCCGVGCSVALPDLFTIVDAVSAAHGRTLSIATALHRVLPDTPILAYGGDGDLTTIGIGELVNTILRNEKIVCVLIDNNQFSMTGHQMSSLTPTNTKTKTTIEGRKEENHGIPVNIKHLMKLNPKAYYYLTHSTSRQGIDEFKDILLNAFNNNGFSLIHVLSPCPTFWGDAKKSYQYSKEYYEQKKKESVCKCEEK